MILENYGLQFFPLRTYSLDVFFFSAGEFRRSHNPFLFTVDYSKRIFFPQKKKKVRKRGELSEEQRKYTFLYIIIYRRIGTKKKTTTSIFFAHCFATFIRSFVCLFASRERERERKKGFFFFFSHYSHFVVCVCVCVSLLL